MKKRKLLMFMLALLPMLGFVSCSEESETVEEFPNWQATNEAYYDSIYNVAVANADGSWKVIRNYSFQDSIELTSTDYIAVHVLTEGTGSGCPMFTDSVVVSYSGRLIPSTSYSEGYIFDYTYSGTYNPETSAYTTLVVSEVIDGFSTALQNMHIGDVWRVYMPYQLGYGESGSSSIPAYSTLIFDIALKAYYRPDHNVSRTAGVEPKGVWITE
ncbi:MAG: FKBP-type peptidyl-prolyl cis-trans isomerase [Prevotellaceae bacterium]|nr:FKBP-type peptidyl-prolyl cis-trans isomerase [Prevotellaceae bacterium]